MFRVLLSVAVATLAVAQEGPMPTSLLEHRAPRKEREPRQERDDALTREQRRKIEQEESNYGYCGPDICFSRDGAKCFQNHPANFCMQAIYVCMKYIIVGCKEDHLEQMKKEAHRHIDMMESPEALEQPASFLFLAAAAPAALTAVGLWAGPSVLDATRQKLGGAISARQRHGKDDYTSPLLG